MLSCVHRRSTRIQEHEQRTQAEKIRQENIQKEKEDKEAMRKVSPRVAHKCIGGSNWNMRCDPLMVSLNMQSNAT